MEYDGLKRIGELKARVENVPPATTIKMVLSERLGTPFTGSCCVVFRLGLSRVASLVHVNRRCSVGVRARLRGALQYLPGHSCVQCGQI
jgi:hypothetical protein